MIKVVNTKTHVPNENSVDFYIGRGSVLGNPYTHIKTKNTQAAYIVETRYEAIEKYKEYIKERIEKKDQVVCDELNKLWKAAKNGDINLVCYCSPKSCHGDTIKTIIEQKL